MSGKTKLTKAERWALEQLERRHAACVRQGFGMNPSGFGGSRAAKLARQMEPRGLVAVTRYSDTHFRYTITDAGRAALNEGGER